MSGEQVGSPTNTADEAYEEKESTAVDSAKSSEENGGSRSSKGSDSVVQVITRFMCKFCGMQFIRRPDMDAHASLHAEEKPPLTCGVCGKVYNTRSKLQRHVRVHSGERPFPCVICGKRFPRSDHVKQHMRVHAKFPGELASSPNPLGLTHKSYCRLCGVKFEQRSELNTHLLTHGFNKLFSCIYCGEVFESNDKLKAHKITHENQLDEYLPVLSVPDLSMSSKLSVSFPKAGAKRKRPGRPKGSGTANKRRKELSRIGFSKFKIARRSGSESWQAIGEVLKTEESEKPVTTADKTSPILEQILKENDHSAVKSEEETAENDSDCSNAGASQMSISACYSLAEGQDNSDIPDIDEIRASTLSDGNNMIVVPMGHDVGEVGDSSADMGPRSPDRSAGETGHSESSLSTAVCTVTGSRTDTDSDTRGMQANFIRPTMIPATATATAALMTLQQQVYPQIASTMSSTTASPSASFTATTTTTATTMASTAIAATTSVIATTTRPTISLLPNVLAFRTHPILTTPTLNLASNAVHPTSIYNPGGHLYNSLGNFAAGPTLQARGGLNCAGPAMAENFPLGRKMMRCQYCCIWFEDSALGLLHQSLHSADETDPFTCKKCLKRLGNRLEFTAHIIWHLDPTMEDSAVV